MQEHFKPKELGWWKS